MLPSETPLKPFSESYVDFALPIEVQSCDNAFYVPYSVCKKYFQFNAQFRCRASAVPNLIVIWFDSSTAGKQL